MVAGSGQTGFYVSWSSLILLIVHLLICHLICLGIIQSKAQCVTAGKRSTLVVQINHAQTCLDGICLALIVHIATAIYLLQFALYLRETSLYLLFRCINGVVSHIYRIHTIGLVAHSQSNC